MQTAGYILEYLLLDFFSYEKIPTSQQKFGAEISFSSFDFGVDF